MTNIIFGALIVFFSIFTFIFGFFASADATNGIKDTFPILITAICLFVWGVSLVVRSKNNDVVIQGEKRISSVKKILIVIGVAMISGWFQSMLIYVLHGSLLTLPVAFLIYFFSLYYLIEKYEKGYSKKRVTVIYLAVFIILTVLSLLIK